MLKPDVVFTVRVCPVFHVFGCAEKQAQEARGLFGFHLFTSCPNCKVVFSGWQFWGENGHLQGNAPTRALMAHWLKRSAMRQWRTKAGQLMGYRFVSGGTMHYKGDSHGTTD